MNRAFSVGTILDSQLRMHWSFPALPVAAAAFGFATLAWREAAYNLLVLLAMYLVVIGHQWTRTWVARRFGLGTRDVTLYPFWGVARLTRLSDRPWQEYYISGFGILFLALVPTGLGVGLSLAGHDLEIPAAYEQFSTTEYLMRTMFASVVLLMLHCLPLLPLDGGQIQRAYLAMGSTRLKATETAAIVSTVGALVMLGVAVFGLQSYLVGVTAVLVYLGAQEELGTTRYFEGMRHKPSDRMRTPAAVVAVDQAVTSECRPGEPDFTGFTWNADARLWIEWRQGRAISANALLGENP